MADHAREYTDTSSAAMQAWIEILRGKTQGERIEMTFQLTDFALRVQEAGMRARHPDATEREIFLRCAALRIPRDLMVKAYGWDPMEHGAPCMPESASA